MENHFLLTDDLLWDYADGFLTGAEKDRVDAYLQQHPEHRERLNAILSEKRAFSSLSFEKPDKGFSDRVMAAWVSEQARAGAMAPVKKTDWILLAIMGVLGVLIAVGFILVIGTAPEAPAVEIPNQYIPEVPVIDWASVFGSALFRYGILVTICLLSLQILDKYLQLRTRSHGLLSL